jgi:hypothetical protein
VDRSRDTHTHTHARAHTHTHTHTYTHTPRLTVEEVRLELAGTSPLPGERTKSDLAAARALLLEEIEAEKAAIARLTAAADDSPTSTPGHSTEIRHMADAHALRKANLNLSTHLRVAKMRLVEAERIAARTIR